MKLLALDSSTEACSVALLSGDSVLHRYQLAPQQHAQLLLPMIDELLAEAGIGIKQLDGLAFGCGPGSFTGVRIATSTVQGIAFGADLPVAGVSTLQALAHRAWREAAVETCLATIDARMKQLYVGFYRTEKSAYSELTGEDSVLDPDAVRPPDAAVYTVAGGGARLYASVLAERGFQIDMALADLLPDARDIALLAVSAFNSGHAVPAEKVAPVYLRDKVAFTSDEQRARKEAANKPG